MKKLLFFFFIPVYAFSQTLPTLEDKTKNLLRQEGFINFYWDENAGKIYLEIPQTETEILYQTSSLSPQLLELRNMITVGYLVVKGATFRKESRGLHFNTDYPGKSSLVQNIVL